MPNWTTLPSGSGISWKVWNGDAVESGHCKTKEQAMSEVREACQRIKTIEVEAPDPVITRLKRAHELMWDAKVAIDERTCTSCINQALEHIDKALTELEA